MRCSALFFEKCSRRILSRNQQEINGLFKLSYLTQNVQKVVTTVDLFSANHSQRCVTSVIYFLFPLPVVNIFFGGC